MAVGGGTPAQDGGNLGLLPPGDRGNPGARLPGGGANRGPLPPRDSSNPGPLWFADPRDLEPLPPGNGSNPGPPGPPVPAAGPTGPVWASRHRRRRPLAPKAGRLRLRGALAALAAFLVIVTVVLVATDNEGPPAPNGTAAQSGPVTEPNGQIAPPPNYKLAFSTDFPGNALDTSTWAQCYPESPAPPGCSNFGNADVGKGLWPAIWLIPADQSWPPEIDIVEHWDTQPTAEATLHYGKQRRGTVNFPDADKGWHTYTLYWTQSRITIYYDNRLALTTTAHIPQQAMYLLLDLANENDTPGSCSGTMYVKSVNIWEPPAPPGTG